MTDLCMLQMLTPLIFKIWDPWLFKKSTERNWILFILCNGLYWKKTFSWNMLQCIVVSILCTPWLGNQGIMYLFMAGLRGILVIQNVHTALGDYPASNWVSAVRSLELKQIRYEIYCLPPSSCHIMSAWSCTSTLPYAFIICSGPTWLCHLCVVQILLIKSIM